MHKTYFLLLLSLLMMACNTKETTQTKENERIISLNGSITEILVELGQQQNIIAVDVTSTYPLDLKQNIKDLGHANKVNIESILALEPTSIYATSSDLNQNTLEQLAKTNIQVEIIEQDFSLEGTKSMIEQVARSLNNDTYLALIDKIESQSKQITISEKSPKVLFIYARGASTLMVAGNNTPLDKMITLAGGQNAVQGFDNYKPLTPESLINANPDYILMFTSGLQSVGDINDVLQIEGISQTNAGKNARVIAMDGQYLSGFGPRVSQAILELNQLITQE